MKTRIGIDKPMRKIKKYVKYSEVENISIDYEMAAKATPAKVTGLRPTLSARGAKMRLPRTTALKNRLPKRPN